MTFLDKLLCIVVAFSCGCVAVLILWRIDFFLKRRTDTKSKVRYASRTEDELFDRNHRITEIRGSLFVLDDAKTEGGFFSHYYKSKAEQVEKHG